MPPVVSLNNILVLQGDSFKLSVEHLVLQPGLIYALTGANGSGKSTLLRVMALLTPPPDPDSQTRPLAQPRAIGHE